MLKVNCMKIIKTIKNKHKGEEENANEEAAYSEELVDEKKKEDKGQGKMKVRSPSPRKEKIIYIYIYGGVYRRRRKSGGDQ